MSPLAVWRASFALLALVVIAPNARASDAETITTCLKTETAAGRDFHACVGRVSGPCIEVPATQSDSGMAECTRRETKIWDDILNDEYGRLMGLLKEKPAQSVRQAQRLWVAMRDFDCRVPYDLFEGGTAAQLGSSQCMLDHTADRAMQLRDWRETAQAN